MLLEKQGHNCLYVRVKYMKELWAFLHQHQMQREVPRNFPLKVFSHAAQFKCKILESQTCNADRVEKNDLVEGLRFSPFLFAMPTCGNIDNLDAVYPPMSTCGCS